MKVFLALPSKIADTRYGGPSAEECRELIKSLEELHIEVICPLSEVDFQDRIPAAPVETITHRLRALEDAQWVIAHPSLGDYKSSGVMGYIYWALAKDKNVIVLQRGAGNLHLPWQIVGLRDSGMHSLSVVFYQGSIASGFEGLMRAMTNEHERDRRESISTPTYDCAYGNQYEWYWGNRHLLFSRWSDGMECDAEGLCSIKPEAIATFIAEHMRGAVVLDAFCGVGSVAIAFARAGKRVIAVDTNTGRLSQARRNAEIYEVERHIEFVHANVFDVFESIPHDAVYIDPSWGGPRYRRKSEFGFSDFEIEGHHDIRELLRMEFNSGKRIAMSMPINFDSAKLVAMHHQLARRENLNDVSDLDIRWHSFQRRKILMTAFF